MNAQTVKTAIKRGELARRTGCNLETIRYYESIGIMPDPARSTSGHRLYDQTDQNRLRFILRCRELGFSIEELRKLLKIVDSDEYTCQEVLVLTDQYLATVAQKIADLQDLESRLQGIAKQCPGGDAPVCPIIDALFEP